MLWCLCLGMVNVYGVDDPDQAVAAAIRRLRGDQAQEALAFKAGVSTSTISRIERGQHKPSLPTLRKIAAGLGISLAELIEAADHPEE
jgi:transcriptional regulator with XRE-family HTH domain